MLSILNIDWFTNAQLLFLPRMFSETHFGELFCNIREIFQTTCNLGLVWNSGADHKWQYSSNQVQPVFVWLQ